MINPCVNCKNENYHEKFQLEKCEKSKEFNRFLQEHCKKYCDKKCPSGDKGSHGWHGKEGTCWDCVYNPYKMYPELRENK